MAFRQKKNGDPSGRDMQVAFWQATGITLLAFFLSTILLQPFSLSIATLISSNDKRDFDITDFYNIIADSRAVRAVDRDITILDITDATREDVALILDALPDFEPRAVGLDVMFDVPHADDSLLLDALRRLPDIVLLVDVEPTKAHGADVFMLGDTSFFYNDFRGYTYGASNLPTKGVGGVVREFVTSFPMDDGSQMPSFAAAVVSKVDTTALASLAARGTHTELINYPSRRFRSVYWEELGDHADDIRDHVVLIGAVGNPADMHATPPQKMMSGIEVHARAVSTILNDNYMTPLPRFWNMAIAFVLCFALALIHIKLPAEFKALVLRVIQIGLLYVIIVTGYHFFIDRSIVINFSYTLLMLTFVLFACDIWLGVKGVRKYWKKYRTNRNNSQGNS